MIGSIGSGPNGGYLTVSGGYSSLPYVAPNSNNPMTGMIRSNSGRLEMFDGSIWMTFSGPAAEVSLSGAAITALDWATKKMTEEAKILELAKTNVTVADAWENYQLAQEQLKVVLTLTDDRAK